MPEAYLKLSREEQAVILKKLSTNIGIKRDALLLELENTVNGK